MYASLLFCSCMHTKIGTSPYHMFPFKTQSGPLHYFFFEGTIALF